MADGDGIGVVQAAFEVDVTGAIASLQGVGEQFDQTGKRAEASAVKIAETGNVVDRVSAMTERAVARSVAAWNRELMAQERAKAAQEETARAKELAALKADILARSEDGLAGSIEHVAGAMSHTVPQVAAASGAIRVLEGSMPIRAVERFATTTLGLGPILQAAFPVFGAIAFGEMVGHVGKELFEAFDMAGERARKTADDIRADSDALRSLSDDLTVEADKIDIANAKVAKRPISGIKLALDEAIAASDRLGDRLDANLKKIEATIKGMSGSWAQQALGTAAGTGYEQTMVREHARHLDEAVTEQDKLNESTSYGNSLLTRKAELERMTADPGASPAFSNLRNEISAVDHLIALQGKEQSVIKASMTVDQSRMTGAGIPKDDHGHADEERMRADEETYNKLRMGHQLTLKEEGEFWAERLSKYAANTSQYASITGRLAEIYDKGASEAHKQFDALRKQISAPVPAGGNASQMFEHKDTEAEADERINRALEEQKKAAADIYGFTVRQIDLKEKLGQLTASQAAQQKLAASQAEQSAIVGPLQAQQKSMAPLGPIMLDDKQLAEYRRLQDQITAAMDQGAKQREQIVEQEALREQQQYQKLFNAINGPLNTFVDHWLTSGLRMGAALQKMYDSMAMSAINALLKIGEKWAAHELLLTASHLAGLATRAGADANYAALSNSQLLAQLAKWIAMEWAKVTHHVAANTAKTTSDVASAAASTAGAASAAAAKAAIDIGVAISSTGAGAAAAGAAVAAASGPAAPVAGPAAAAAYTAAMAPFIAMAAFEKGGVVQGAYGYGVPILAHAGERVLTAAQNSNIERIADQDGSNSGSSEIHFHDHSSWSGVDGASVEGMYRKHAASGRREMTRQLRLMNKI